MLESRRRERISGGPDVLPPLFGTGLIHSPCRKEKSTKSFVRAKWVGRVLAVTTVPASRPFPRVLLNQLELKYSPPSRHCTAGGQSGN